MKVPTELHNFSITGTADNPAEPAVTPSWLQLAFSSGFITKYRHPVLTAGRLDRTEEITRAVCADFVTEIAEFNGETDHVHLLVNFPPKIAPSRLVNSLKGVSSRRLRQEFPDLVPHYWRAKPPWSGSYFAGSVAGAASSALHHYIEQQDRPS